MPDKATTSIHEVTTTTNTDGEEFWLAWFLYYLGYNLDTNSGEK